MENRKYLKDGRAVALVQALDNGKFLVKPLWFLGDQEVTFDDPDEEEEYIVDDSSPIIVDKVFDRAPLELYDTDVAQRQAELARLNVEITKASAEQRMAERENAERLARLKKFEPLKELEALIENGYTHTVDFDGDTIGRIVEAAVDRDREFPMLTLRGALSWNKVPHWTISVGQRGAVIPCTSLEQAQGIVREKIEEALRHGDMNRASSDVVRRADEMGIPVPVAYRKRVLENLLGNMSDRWPVQQAERANQELANHNQRKAELQAQLEALNNPPAVNDLMPPVVDEDPFV